MLFKSLKIGSAAAAVCIAGASLSAFAERTVSIESVDPTTREIALAFGGTAAAEEAVMIAYGDKDYGTDFAAWPYRRQLGTIAADATGATFTIPTGWDVDPGGKTIRIFTGAATILPYDSEVEYIQGTGTGSNGAYIYTGVTPLCTDKVEFEIMPRTVSGNQSIFCARSGMSDNSTFTCFTIGSTFRFDRIASGAATSGAISTGKRYAATADYGTGAVNIKCDGVDFYTGTMPTTSFTVGGPLVLFSSYNTYTASTEAYATWNNGGTYNLYRFKLAGADGTVKLDLVPVIKDGVAYLYDKKSGELLGKSGGTGAFGHGIVMSDGVSLAASGVSEAVAGRMISLTAFDAETGVVSLKFSGVSLSPAQTLVVAFGSKDCGEDLASWDANKRFLLGTVEADATSGTYTLPAPAIATGTFFRLFLVDNATVDDAYDEEVAWIQPETLGAYMNTGYKPPAAALMEMKINLNNLTYAEEVDIFRAKGSQNGFRLRIKADLSQFHVYRAASGNAYFNSAGKTIDQTLTMNYKQAASNTKLFTVNGTGYGSNNFNWGGTAAATEPLLIWTNDGTSSFSCPKLYYMKWKNSSSAVQADFIPVVKDGEYCLYDKVGKTLIHNAGAEGTAFMGGAVVGYPALTPSGAQSASAAKKSGTVGITEFDNSTFNATLTWTAPGKAASVWMVYKVLEDGEEPEDVALDDWDAGVKLGDITATSTGGTFTVGNLPTSGRSSMRFVVAPADATPGDIAPLMYSAAMLYEVEEGVPILDMENCAITASGDTATVAWALAKAGTDAPDVKATFSAEGVEHNAVLAEDRATGSSGTATVPGLWSKGAITATLYAENSVGMSTPVVVTLGATGAASIPSAPVLAPDTSLKQIAASGTVGLGSGTTVAWLEYGATTAYGTKIGLTLGEEGAWTATIPFDDVLWAAGKACVRVTASNEVTGVFGTMAWQNEAAANTTFAPSARTLELTGLDETAGTATLAFGGDAAAAQTLVVAWGDQDYGANLDDWPYAQHAAIGTVAADATSGTFTLPAEALVSGNCYRFFLGDGIIEGAEWIQPAVEGAYMNTDFMPTAGSTMHAKVNFDSQTYSEEVDFYHAGGYRLRITADRKFHVFMPNNGNDSFGEFPAAEDLSLSMRYVKGGGAVKVFNVNGTGYGSNNFNWNGSGYVVKDATVPLYIFSSYGGAGGYSKLKLYGMSWTNSSNNAIANFIPAKTGGEYCLYDTVGKKILRNAGAEGTSFTGGGYDYVNAICFANVQTAASGARFAGSIELAALDYGTFDATLAWPALPAASTLWVVYSDKSPGEDPGAFNLADWDECVKLDDIAAGSEGGTYNLGDPSGTKRATMRFIIATAGSTAEDITPLNVSGAYRFKKEGLSVFIR